MIRTEIESRRDAVISDRQAGALEGQGGIRA